MQVTAQQATHAVTDKLGRPLRDLRISVTDRCNWRCTYCMPAEIFGERYEFMPKSEILTFEEIERLAKIFVGLGVSKLRITGGEPTVRADLPGLLSRLSAISGPDGLVDLTLTTNGYLLGSMAQKIRDAGLRRITVHLDSLDDATFRKMSGRPYGPERTLEGIDAAAKVGLRPIKINCVVQRGANNHQIVDMARHFKGTGHIVRFIEFMDVGTRNAWNLNQVVPASEILHTLSEAFPLKPAEPNYSGEVAERYLYEDGSGEVGIISSVSKPFCGDCTRARLTTDGRLVTCLFATNGKDLKTPMRSGATDEDLKQVILGVWSRRTDRYSELRSARTNTDGSIRRSGKRIEMYQLGG